MMTTNGQRVTPPKKQCVWIVRYGLTQFPLVENVGPFDSDIGSEGVEHAHAIAASILDDLETDDNTTSFTTVYSSPFQRCAHTAHILATTKGRQQQRRVCIEEGLTEWLTPELLVEPSGKKTEARSVEALSELYDSIDCSHKSVNPVLVATDETSRKDGSPMFPETEQALLRRCAVTLDRLLENSTSDESFCIISHAPCDQALALHLEGAPSVGASKLGPWPLGGITKFSRLGGDSEWTLDYYGKTTHMPGEYKAGIKEWSLPCLTSKK